MWLDGNDDQWCAACRRATALVRLDSVAFGELGESLGPRVSRNDVTRLVRGSRDQPGDEGFADLAGADDRYTLGHVKEKRSEASAGRTTCLWCRLGLGYARFHAGDLDAGRLKFGKRSGEFAPDVGWPGKAPRQIRAA